jgi:hypothetical protein
MFVLFGQGAPAFAILSPLLVDRSRVQGRHHPDTLETRKYLAVADALQHPCQAHTHHKTVRELRRILRRQTTKHGLDHPTTRDTRQWLAAFAGPTEKP